jgi:hypothetical protein
MVHSYAGRMKLQPDGSIIHGDGDPVIKGDITR